jgi:hypothetical protein
MSKVSAEKKRFLRIWMVCKHGRDSERCCTECFRAAELAAGEAMRKRIAYWHTLEAGRAKTWAEAQLHSDCAKAIEALPLGDDDGRAEERSREAGRDAEICTVCI